MDSPLESRSCWTLSDVDHAWEHPNVYLWPYTCYHSLSPLGSLWYSSEFHPGHHDYFKNQHKSNSTRCLALGSFNTMKHLHDDTTFTFAIVMTDPYLKDNHLHISTNIAFPSFHNDTWVTSPDLEEKYC